VKGDSPASEVMIRLRGSTVQETDTADRHNTAGEGTVKNSGAGIQSKKIKPLVYVVQQTVVLQQGKGPNKSSYQIRNPLISCRVTKIHATICLQVFHPLLLTPSLTYRVNLSPTHMIILAPTHLLTDPGVDCNTCTHIHMLLGLEPLPIQSHSLNLPSIHSLRGHIWQSYFNLSVGKCHSRFIKLRSAEEICLQWSIIDVCKDIPVGTDRSKEKKGKDALKSDE
jgi:hypothetical protein